MRERKYRAWDKRFKRMVYNNAMAIFGNYPQKYIMDFIGHEDKNKKEIYESDVLNVRRYSEQKWDVGCIEYSEILCQYLVKCYYKKMDGEFFSIRFEEIGEFEIIGNIYENPELMEGK